MARELVTKIVYDVSEAIANLNKLNDASEKAGKKVKGGLGEGSKAAKLFQQALGKLPGSAGKAAQSLTKLVGTTGPLVAGVGAAGAAIGSLALQFIDIPSLIGDATAELEKFREGSERIRQSQDRVSAQQDARINRELVLERRRLTLQQARLTEIQALSDEAIRALDKELEALKRNTTESERLQDRLERRRLDRTAGPGGISPDPDIRAATLLEAATKEAQQGNIDRAEELVQKAESLKGELENQVFFLSGGRREPCNRQST